MESNELETNLIRLINKQQLFQWENYANGKKNDLNIINKEIYSLIKNIDPENIFKGNSRKRKIFKNLYNKLMIENDYDIAKLRNKLDNIDNYKENLNKKDNKKLILAKEMKEDVIKLINLRNKKAKEKGFKSYPDLIFSVEELSKDEVIKDIRDYLDKNINKAKRLIKNYNLNWDNWFAILREKGTLTKNNTKYYINCFLNKLDLYHIFENIKFKYDINGISGMTFRISPPDDIRVLLKPVTSPMTSRVLFHECGHAISYIFNEEKGIYNLYTTSFDEIMSVLFEKIGIQLCLSDNERIIAEDVSLLENIRCSISFLFEMDLWKNPDNGDKMFIEHQSILPMKPQRKELWTLDSFRYIDPVYVHNYVLGEIYSKKILNHFKNQYNDNYRKWSYIIIDHFLKDGLKKSFMDKYNSLINNRKNHL